MGKTMAKSNVIWGEKHSVSLASFNDNHMEQILDLIESKVGLDVDIKVAAMKEAVKKAKLNTKMKNGYVKVGVIGSDLVLRAKEKKFLGDIEIDAIAVPDYKTKAKNYQFQLKLREKQPVQEKPIKVSKPISQPKKEIDPTALVEGFRLEALKNTRPWHANLNNKAAAEKLSGKSEGAYLLHAGSKTGSVIVSYLIGNKAKHEQLATVGEYRWYLQFAKKNAQVVVTPDN